MSTPPDTREKILQAALGLFAEKGFDGASLREITAEADVNLAAVNYHFGSKEALIAELFSYLVEPANHERIQRLDALEEAAGDGPLPLEEVVKAFIEPPLLTWSEYGSLPMRFLGRLYADPSEAILKNFRQVFSEVAERFHAAMARSLPHLSVEEVFWRIHFTVGAMTHVMAAHEIVKVVHPEHQRQPAAEEVVRRMMPFLCGGMRAPATPAGEGGAEG
jgi:AcrR family transcriptional regulator